MQDLFPDDTRYLLLPLLVHFVWGGNDRINVCSGLVHEPLSNRIAEDQERDPRA